MLTPEPNKDWGAAVISAMLAVGLASVFLSPLWLTGQPEKEQIKGQVLGESISLPLKVTVQVSSPLVDERFEVTVPTGTVAEALARAAAASGQELAYHSRGDSIYLDIFSGLKNARGGRWVIELNGRPMIDLNGSELIQGDVIFANWKPSI